MPPTSPLAALRRLLVRSPRALYVLDDSRSIVFANQALADWAGAAVQQLIGLRCDYSGAGSQADSQATLGAGLCPAPEALAGERQRTVVQVPCDGRWRRRAATTLAWSEHSTHEPRPTHTAVIVLLDETDLAGGDDESLDAAERLHRDVVRLRTQLPQHATFHLLGESPLMRRVRQQVAAASAADASVLIVGPPGAGREEVAKAVCYGSDESKGLLPLSCPLLDAELLANALEDLQRSHRELIGAPDTILLLDVDCLPVEAQGSLYDRLRRLDPAPRLLATASAPLHDNDDFHDELALFLSGLMIELPPLAARPRDIPQLAQLVLQDHNAHAETQLSGFEIEAMDLLLLYPWHENQAELQRLVTEACQRAEGVRVAAADLPQPLHAAMSQAAHPPRAESPIDLPSLLEEVERELIQRAMRLAKGNKAQAARLLSIRRSRLLRRLAALGLDASEAGQDDGEAGQGDGEAGQGDGEAGQDDGAAPEAP